MIIIIGLWLSKNLIAILTYRRKIVLYARKKIILRIYWG